MSQGPKCTAEHVFLIKLQNLELVFVSALFISIATPLVKIWNYRNHFVIDIIFFASYLSKNHGDFHPSSKNLKNSQQIENLWFCTGKMLNLKKITFK
jgi:hypothetical protein